MTLFEFIKNFPNKYPEPDPIITRDQKYRKYCLDWDLGVKKVMSIELYDNGAFVFAYIFNDIEKSGTHANCSETPKEVFAFFELYLKESKQ